MKKLYFAIIFALGLLQPCRGCAQSAQDSFYQFLGNFNILSTQDSVLTLQEIEILGNHEVLLDSFYSNFFKKSRVADEGVISCKSIPSSINIFFNSIPYFSSYATFKVDCSDGHLVCICHRFSSNIDLWFLEFISFDKDGIPTSRLYLPYIVNMSESGSDYLVITTKLYVSNSRLCYIIDSYSNLNNYVDERIIHYRINLQGQLVCVSDKKSRRSGCLRSLGSAPPKHIIIE